MTETPLTPTTTAEEDLHSASQRSEVELTSLGHRLTNRVWEYTQAAVATIVTIGVVAISAYMVVYGETQLKLAAFLLLSQVFTQVVTEYFRRTNHTKSSSSEVHR
jgi:hypothetical protein